MWGMHLDLAVLKRKTGKHASKRPHAPLKLCTPYIVPYSTGIAGGFCRLSRVASLHTYSTLILYSASACEEPLVGVGHISDATDGSQPLLHLGPQNPKICRLSHFSLLSVWSHCEIGLNVSPQICKAFLVKSMVPLPTELAMAAARSPVGVVLGGLKVAPFRIRHRPKCPSDRSSWLWRGMAHTPYYGADVCTAHICREKVH